MKRWFRQFLRKKIKPIPSVHAALMKRRFAFWYAFFAWNAGGVFLYIMLQDSYPKTKDEEKRPGHYYARLLQSENVHVVRMKGLTVVDEYDIVGKPKLNPQPEEFVDKLEDQPVDAEILSE